MKDIKIAINSSPRSGHAWLQFLLIRELNHYQELDIGEGITDNFVIRCSVPTMLYGKFDSIQQVTILRKPEDIIPSIITKTIGGLGNTVSSGIPMPHEYPQLPHIGQLLNDQFNIYRAWTNGIINNIDNLKAFTFEQITENYNFVIKTILKEYDIIETTIQHNGTDFLINLAKERIEVHNKGDYGFNNPIPVDKKPDIYYEIKEIVNNHERLNESLEFYNNARNLILSKWSKDA